MPRDIWGRRALEHGGSFAADAAELHFVGFDGFDSGGAVSGAGLLTQQLSMQYQQPITRLYEIGSHKTFLVVGRPSGQGAISRVLGPRPVLTAFYHTYGDACLADQNSLLFRFEAGCAPDEPTLNNMSVLLYGVVLQSIGLSVRAEDMIVGEQLGFMFISLDVYDELDEIDLTALQSFLFPAAGGGVAGGGGFFSAGGDFGSDGSGGDGASAGGDFGSDGGASAGGDFGGATTNLPEDLPAAAI